MTTFIVMEPQGRRAGETARFVQDRFILTALIFSLFWLLYHRLWLESGLLLVAAILLGMLSALPGHESLVVLLALLIGLFIALEGASLRVAALERRGFRPVRIIEAHDLREAEIRYAADALHRRPVAPEATQVRPVRSATGGDAAMIGMLDYPGAR